MVEHLKNLCNLDEHSLDLLHPISHTYMCISPLELLVVFWHCAQQHLRQLTIAIEMSVCFIEKALQTNEHNKKNVLGLQQM